MALKKSDLYSSLWQSCDELRGGMDACQYKDYILTLLFVKYVTDKAKSDPNTLIDVPAGGSFDDMVALKGDKEIGDKINKIIGKLAEANGLQKVIDLADFNDEEKLGKGKEMQDRLTKLVTIFADLDFRGSRAEGDDLLGDAYEYLMRHFATESGKSKGQFYTPAEVSRVMAKIVGIGARHPAGPDGLRPHLRLRVVAAQSRRRGAARHHDLRPGEGQRHLGAVQDEHDPPRQRGRATSARATRSPARSSPRAPSYRPSTSPSPIRRSRSSRGATALRTTMAASSSAGRRRRTATTPSCYTS